MSLKAVIILFSIIISLIPNSAKCELLNQKYIETGAMHMPFIYNTAIHQDVIDTIKKKGPIEPENPFRRFEIIYFISLPFAFLLNYLTLQAYEELKPGGGTVSVWKEHESLLIGSTLVIPGLIAAYDSFILPCFINDEHSNNSNNQSFYLGITKKY